MTGPVEPSAPAAPDPPPAPRTGVWTRIGGGCVGFGLFYLLAFGAIISIVNTRAHRTVAATAIAVAIAVLVVVVWRFPPGVRAAAAAGFAGALVVFGGCLTLM